MLIAVALMSVVLSSVALVTARGQRSFRANVQQVRVESDAARALGRVVSELLTAGLETLVPDPGGVFGTETLTYQQPVGFAGGVVAWGPPRRLAFRFDPADPEDGIDNDGDGLVDEGELVLTRNLGAPNERTVVLCRGVRAYLEGETFDAQDQNGNGLIDERGFSVQREGNLLTLRLSLEDLDQDGERVVRTVESSLRLRN